MDMRHLLTWGARIHANRTAFVCGGVSLTFRETDRLATRLANGLRRIGIEKGDRVAVLVGNRIEYGICEFAVAKCGAMRVPLLVKSTVAELVRWLNVADCSAVIACPDGIETLRQVRSQGGGTFSVVAIEAAGLGEHDYGELIAESSDDEVDVELTPEDPSAIRFTGGTTGAPKGIVMSHRTMVATVVNSLLNMPIQKTDVGLTLHPMTHACGFMMYNYWVAGATNVISPAFGFKASSFVAAVEKYRITSILMIPTLLNVILDAPEVQGADLSSIRHIVYGGAPIPQTRLAQGLARFGPVFQQIYGLSEAPMLVATLRQDEHLLPDGSKPSWFGSVGREAFNCEIKIADEGGRALGPDEIGEIYTRGDHTMACYWRNPDLTAKRYDGRWVRTGDMGYLDRDGYLFLVDRKEDMIITGGFNVWPVEIEEVLFSHPAVFDACVFGVKDEMWGEAVSAMVVLKADASSTEAEIIAYAAARLSKYKVPKRVLISDAPLPKSGVGKPLRALARERFLVAVAAPARLNRSES